MQSIISSRRFGGMARLYGLDGAEQIARSHVLIVGIGGVGSWIAEALARSGVGEITLIDMDHIAESNINRQIHALESTIGQAKVLAMKERIAQINSECRVHVVDDFVTPDNWAELVSNIHVSSSSILPLTAVVDACDQVKAKVVMADWALRQKFSWSPWVLQVESEKRTLLSRLICRRLPMIHSCPKCVIDLEKKRVPLRMVKKWVFVVYSAVKMLRHQMLLARLREMARSTAMVMDLL